MAKVTVTLTTYYENQSIDYVCLISMLMIMLIPFLADVPKKQYMYA
jgi:hypothetical protein